MDTQFHVSLWHHESEVVIYSQKELICENVRKLGLDGVEIGIRDILL